MYFIKLYDSFVNSDEIRWIESQEDGAEIVLIFRWKIKCSAWDAHGFEL